MLKIGIDIRTINKPRSGVGYYITNLIREFQSIDTENEYCLISNNGIYESEFEKKPNFSHCSTRISNENHLIGDLWENFYLPSFLKRNGVQVFHGPAFMIPLIKGSHRSVTTIHDIVAYKKPETVPLKYALYMRLLIKMVAMRADKIISPSISTKNDLIEILGVPEDKITVTYEAIGKEFRPPEPDETFGEIRRKFGIRDRFMLFAGNLEPRKNLVRLIQAYDRARARLGGQYQLVICGKRGWLYDDIIDTYERLNGDGSIVLTNYVSEKELIQLYQAADFFVFPSLYEGFGLPPLEAMGCGCPVITSNVSSLPEIAGDAARYVDPLSVEDITEAIVNVAQSESLREELRAKGLEQARRFSWTETARRTLDAYQSVL